MFNINFADEWIRTADLSTNSATNTADCVSASLSIRELRECQVPNILVETKPSTSVTTCWNKKYPNFS